MATENGFFSLGQNAIDRAGQYAPGYQFGNGVQAESKDKGLTGQSNARADQTKLERIAEQRGNFFYGGSATGGQDAIAAARANLDPYAGQLYGNGNLYHGAGMNAASREAPLATDYLGMDKRGQFNQYSVADQMQAAAQNGPGPSVAQANLVQNSNNAMMQQLAMAGSGRGAGGGASAFRQAGMNNANIQSQANAQAATLGAQEANDWQQQRAALLSGAGSLYGQGRASDMAAANYQSGVNLQQTGLNDQMQMGMGGLSNQAILGGAGVQAGTEGLAHSINQGALSGSMGYEGQLAQLYGISQGVGVQNAALDAQREGAMWNAAGAGLSTLLTTSDITAKDNIQIGRAHV